MNDLDKYYDRPNSKVIDHLMREYHVERKEFADSLHLTVKQFKYKMVTNDFNMKDFINLILYISKTKGIPSGINWHFLFTDLAKYYKKEKKNGNQRKHA